MKDYEGKIRLVVRYMPLHPNSLSAATFTEAAGEQGKYWQAQEMLFKNNRNGEQNTDRKPDCNRLMSTRYFKKYAVELGLDPRQNG